MNPKRTKQKERRRARKMAEQAWQAVQDGQLDLAAKIIRRAAETQPDNPVLWNDQGMILAMLRRIDEAEQSFHAALSLAPDYAEPYHHLAAIALERGWLDKALRLATQATALAPDVATYRERMDLYYVLVEQAAEPHEPERAEPTLHRVEPAENESILAAAVLRDVTARLDALDWFLLGQRLTREGCVLIGGLLEPPVCAELRGLFDQDDLFAKTVVMDQPAFGQGEYRYFKSPVPAIVDGMRRTMYPHAARIANEWQRLLGADEQYPEAWDEFRAQCSAAGQTVATPILLKYEAGGFNALHRDLRGEIFFPIQLAIVLSPRAVEPDDAGFRGGEFLFCDVPETAKSQQRSVPAGLGDALLFCTRDRLVRVGDTWGLQPVKHGVATITSGVRFVLGLPFHEYA